MPPVPTEPTGDGIDLGPEVRPLDLGDALPPADADSYTVRDGSVYTVTAVSFAQPSLSGVPPDVPPSKLVCTARVRRGRAPRLRHNHRRRGSRRASGIRTGQDPGDGDPPGVSTPQTRRETAGRVA